MLSWMAKPSMTTLFAVTRVPCESVTIDSSATRPRASTLGRLAVSGRRRWRPGVGAASERQGGAAPSRTAVLRAITPPTLVLRSEGSHMLDRDVAERMAKELPRGRFIEIPRAIHTLHEDNPEAVLAAMRDFLGF